MIKDTQKSGEKSIHPDTVIFSGFARLPANAASMYIVGVLAVEIEVDPYDMKIVDAACNCLPPLGQKFLVSLLVGNKIENGMEDAIKMIRARYFSTAQRAMIAALEDVQKNYREYLSKGKVETENGKT